VPEAAAAASTVPSAAKPTTVTFAAIKQLRERCPFADMKLCKEALRDHGCDITLAAEALEANRV
jgi:translation elongation factor EF-Ts